MPCMNPIPHTWKEARRLQAWQLRQHGWSQRQIAEAMGVSEGAVSQWMTRAREAGPEALRRRPPPGAPRRLSSDQLARLPELLHRGPAALAFAERCGPGRASPLSSAWNLASPIIRGMWAACAKRCAG